MAELLCCRAGANALGFIMDDLADGLLSESFVGQAKSMLEKEIYTAISSAPVNFVSRSDAAAAGWNMKKCMERVIRTGNAFCRLLEKWAINMFLTPLKWSLKDQLLNTLAGLVQRFTSLSCYKKTEEKRAEPTNLLHTL